MSVIVTRYVNTSLDFLLYFHILNTSFTCMYYVVVPLSSVSIIPIGNASFAETRVAQTGGRVQMNSDFIPHLTRFCHSKFANYLWVQDTMNLNEQMCQPEHSRVITLLVTAAILCTSSLSSLKRFTKEAIVQNAKILP